MTPGRDFVHDRVPRPYENIEWAPPIPKVMSVSLTVAA
jgi:hypothetical protein